MLKNRQDGLVFLHGLFLDFAIAALFVLQIRLFNWTGWIAFNSDANLNLYLMAVVAAMVWSHYSLPRVAVRIGSLSLGEAMRLTRQQVFRLGAVLFAVGFGTQDVYISRAFIGSFILTAAGVLFLANRYLPGRLAGLLFRTLRLRTLVLGSPQGADRLERWLADRQFLGQSLVGCVPPDTGDEPTRARMPVLGDVANLARIIEEQGVNQLIIDRHCFSARQLEQIRAAAAYSACRVRYYVDLCAAFGEESPVVECHDQFAFASEGPEPLDHPVNSLLKRCVDLAVSIPVVILILPPLTLAVWIMQRLQSPGPVFYRQERSGMNRQRFLIFKYRTMYVASGDESRQASRGDSRIYPFGRILRKMSLDEFPQFLNVLLGEMSVSGPRPHMIEHDRQFAEIVGSYYQRHFVKPGITGLAQSEGFRGEVVGSPELLRQRIARDLRYVKMWSLWLDLKILAATARQVVLPPRAAY